MKAILLTFVASLALNINVSTAENITDTYNSGDELTAEKMENIKTAVNSKQNKINGDTCSEPNQAIATINEDGSVTCVSTTTGSDSIDANTLRGISSDKFIRLDDSCEINEASNSNIGLSTDSLLTLSEDANGPILTCERQVNFLISYPTFKPNLESSANGEILHTTTNVYGVIENVGDAFDIKEGKFTAPHDGTYLFSGNIAFRNTSSNNLLPIPVNTSFQFVIEKSGVEFPYHRSKGHAFARSDSNSEIEYFNFSVTAKLNKGDSAYVKMFLLMNTDRTLEIRGSSSEDRIGLSYISGTRIY